MLIQYREQEAAYLEKLNEGIAKGTAWERITDLIGLENSRTFLHFAFYPYHVWPGKHLFPF
jgi:hypothetical protein